MILSLSFFLIFWRSIFTFLKFPLADVPHVVFPAQTTRPVGFGSSSPDYFFFRRHDSQSLHSMSKFLEFVPRTSSSRASPDSFKKGIMERVGKLHFVGPAFFHRLTAQNPKRSLSRWVSLLPRMLGTCPGRSWIGDWYLLCSAHAWQGVCSGLILEILGLFQALNLCWGRYLVNNSTTGASSFYHPLRRLSAWRQMAQMRIKLQIYRQILSPPFKLEQLWAHCLLIRLRTNLVDGLPWSLALPSFSSGVHCSWLLIWVSSPIFQSPFFI